MSLVEICKTADPGAQLGLVFGMDWRVLAFAGLLTTTFSLAILYMVGTFIRNMKLVAWVQSELFQVFATAMVATLIVAWIAGMCNFPINLLSDRYDDPASPNGSQNMFLVADEYINWGLNIGNEVFVYAMGANYFVGLISSFYFNFDPMGVGSKMPPLGAFSQISNLMFVMLSGFMVSYIMFATQALVIKYIAIAMPYFFIPLGIFLRTLSPTREFGGAMVGMGVGLLLFYPLLIVFNDMLVREPIDNAINGMAVEFGARTSFNALKELGETLLNFVTNMAGFWQNLFVLQKELITFVALPLRAVSYYFIIAVVLPVLDFIFLIGVVRSLSKSLGDEVDVTNLTRLI